MCGRYTDYPGEFSDLRITFNFDRDLVLQPRFNLCLRQWAPVIVAGRVRLRARDVSLVAHAFVF